jgi:hypothetical protein
MTSGKFQRRHIGALDGTGQAAYQPAAVTRQVVE